MAGIVAVITKIMPSSPDSDLEEIQKHAQKEMEHEGAMNISFTQEDVAFGLKAIKMKMAWPEEKSTDIIESKLAKVKSVSSVTIEDYRRAFG